MNESSCDDVFENWTLYQTFSFVVPAAARTDIWYGFFYLMIGVFGLLYLLLVVGTTLLLWKRHLGKRLTVKTFIAIDITLLVLGLSRIVFFALDPYGQSEYFICTGCVITSRLVAALGFPSLTASYTLVFITLWRSAKIHLGPSWMQNLKVLFPLCFVHYVVAILLEIVAAFPLGDLSVYLLIGCESFFSICGFLVCFGFLLAGNRLLRSVETSARKSSVVCRDSPSMTRHHLIEKSKFQQRGHRGRTRSTLKLKEMLRDHHRRVIQKVTLITYVTAILAMLYSIVSLTNLTLISLNLFHDCPGYLSGSVRFHPAIWLTIRYVIFVLELCLAVFLTYSICNYRLVIKYFKSSLKTCWGHLGSQSPAPPTNPIRELDIPEISTDSLPRKVLSGIIPTIDVSQSECTLERNGDVGRTSTPSPKPLSPLTVSFKMDDDTLKLSSV